jgi:hypothetical protein
MGTLESEGTTEFANLIIFAIGVTPRDIDPVPDEASAVGDSIRPLMHVPPPTKLTYTIEGCSEHSGHYVAQNILVDAPTDHFSRWSGIHQVPSVKQWILLKLESLSVLSEFLLWWFG